VVILIFFDLVKRCLEIFVHDFSVYGDYYEDCLTNLGKVLRKYRNNHFNLNWEKFHFMVKRGIILGHIISSEGIEVDKAKVDLIANFLLPTSMKDIRSFFRHVGFY